MTDTDTTAPAKTTARKTTPRKRSASSTRKRKDSAPRRSSGGSRRSLKGPLTETITMFAGVVTVAQTAGAAKLDSASERELRMQRAAYDADIIATNAERLAGELDKLAKNNAAVYRALESVCQLGQAAGLGGAVAAIAVPIAANHGIVPHVAARLVDAPTPPTGHPSERGGLAVVHGLPGVELDTDDVDSVAQAMGVSVADLRRAADAFAHTTGTAPADTPDGGESTESQGGLLGPYDGTPAGAPA